MRFLSARKIRRTPSARLQRGTFRPGLEALESRLVPASFAVNAQLAIVRLDHVAEAPAGTHAVVFFESAVADYQVLRQGLDAGTDAVLLDSGGDGLREMAAFLANRHDLTSIGVVAHGVPGSMALGTGALDGQSLGSYSRELTVLGSALGRGGELDLWSCDVAAGQGGASLVNDLAGATGAGVAAADHPLGAESLGGNWQLNVRVAGARGEVPFAAAALGAFPELLGTWSPAASMATARRSQSATLLGNGKVLVAGGYNYNGGVDNFLSSAELYDPASDTWSSAGSMATGRFFQTATLLGNGKVLVTGGYGATGTLSSAELYDPVSNSWSSAGSMATGREWHTATLLSSGKVLVVGGQQTYGTGLSSAELYDPVSNSWSSAGSMATGRFNFAATLLGNGKVLVTGGEGTSLSNILSSAELYDPASNSWSAAASLADARFGHTATLLGSGKVMVTGGNGPSSHLSSAELYDPASDTWSSAGSMATGRIRQTATLLTNGTVLIAGGTDNNALSSAELYDPISNTWSATYSMASDRNDHTATLLSNGKVLVAGGIAFTGPSLSSAELYDPAGVASGVLSLAGFPSPTTAGAAGTFTVTAQNPDGTTNLSYTGTIHLTSSDPQAILPLDYSFTAADQGVHAFSATLKTAGLQLLRADDTTTAGIVGSEARITVNAAAASTFRLAGFPSPTVAGNGGSITVTAWDAFGNQATGYTGTVHFASNDPQAVLPANYTFTAADRGYRFFSDLTLKTAGSKSLTATDTVTGVTGSQVGIVVTPAAASHFVVSGPASVSANTAFSITVTAYDAYGNIATGYRGTVRFTDGAGSSTLPANYTFTASDNGVHTFTGLKLKQKGKHTLTVQDTLTSSIFGSLTINVS